MRRGWRQEDLAARAGVSRWVVSQIERGHLGTMSLDTIERVAGVLEIRVYVVARWRGADLARLVGARHSALHEAVARMLTSIAGWAIAPEVSFSEYGERGIIDILAWHAPTRTLLVIELKTEIVDVQETVGTLDRKRRLAAKIAAARGWHAAAVAVWLIVAESSANRQRVRTHRTMLRAAFPVDGRQIRRWLDSPTGAPAALSFLANAGGSNANQSFAAQKRVRVPSPRRSTLNEGA
jgi:transcriptional regulator with XRE-family HTH domain